MPFEDRDPVLVDLRLLLDRLDLDLVDRLAVEDEGHPDRLLPRLLPEGAGADDVFPVAGEVVVVIDRPVVARRTRPLVPP